MNQVRHRLSKVLYFSNTFHNQYRQSRDCHWGQPWLGCINDWFSHHISPMSPVLQNSRGHQQTAMSSLWYYPDTSLLAFLLFSFPSIVPWCNSSEMLPCLEMCLCNVYAWPSQPYILSVTSALTIYSTNALYYWKWPTWYTLASFPPQSVVIRRLVLAVFSLNVFWCSILLVA